MTLLEKRDSMTQLCFKYDALPVPKIGQAESAQTFFKCKWSEFAKPSQKEFRQTHFTFLHNTEKAPITTSATLQHLLLCAVLAVCYVCLCFCSYRQQHFHALVFSLRSRACADSASSCHRVSSHPCMPVFIPPAISTCQLFVGSSSPNVPCRTVVRSDSACQPFRLPHEGRTAGTVWEAVEAAVNRPLVCRWWWSQLVQLYSLIRHRDLTLQLPFCFLVIIIKVGQARLTHVLNKGEILVAIFSISCVPFYGRNISGLRVWLPSAWSMRHLC